MMLQVEFMFGLGLPLELMVIARQDSNFLKLWFTAYLKFEK